MNSIQEQRNQIRDQRNGRQPRYSEHQGLSSLRRDLQTSRPLRPGLPPPRVRWGPPVLHDYRIVRGVETELVRGVIRALGGPNGR
jgi:hypothetical protein